MVKISDLPEQLRMTVTP